MGTSYPDRTNARGVWKLSDIYKNKISDGTYPIANKQTAICCGGDAGSTVNIIDTVQITTTGDASDFGDLTQVLGNGNAASSVTRGVMSNGYTGSGNVNQMQYIHFESQGNMADFGDSTQSRRACSGSGNSTRGLFAGGFVSGNINVIDFITIASTGNATDFGDRTESRNSVAGGANNTRSLMANGSSGNSNVIDFVEISTTGNAVDFGDLSATTLGTQATSSSTRCVFAGGQPASLFESVQFASLGNAVDFGSLATGTNYHGCTDNSVRGITMGGSSPGNDSTKTNVVQFWNITSAGDSTDFGDLTSARNNSQAVMSNGHGGLQAFFPRDPELYSPTGKVLPRGGGVGDLSVKVGGEGSSAVALIGFNLISTAGNENLFGDLTAARYDTNGCAGDTRMFTWSGTLDGTGGVNSIDYLTFSHKGSTADFGDATSTRQVVGCLANSTRALGAGGGTPSNSNVIDFITIATIGNASDFGDLTSARKGPGGLASTTRGVFGGGTGLSNVMDYVTIASAGNATDFGDLTQARRSAGATSSSTRGVFAGGRSTDSPAAESDVIDYITIGSTGNAQDFGDLTQNRAFLDGTSNSTRAIFTGGYVSSNVNTIDFITIASTGNAADFGDLMVAARGAASGSNGHGGLS